MSDLNDYTPLCDIKDCPLPQTGEIIEADLKLRFRTIVITARLHPCSLHRDQLKRLT